MIIEKKIVRHEIHRNKQVIPIYTLGINGAVVAGLDDCYESNYWVEYYNFSCYIKTLSKCHKSD